MGFEEVKKQSKATMRPDPFNPSPSCDSRWAGCCVALDKLPGLSVPSFSLVEVDSTPQGVQFHTFLEQIPDMYQALFWPWGLSTARSRASPCFQRPWSSCWRGTGPGLNDQELESGQFLFLCRPLLLPLIPNIAVACDFHLFTEHELNIMYSILKIWRLMLLWPLFYRWRN